MKRVNNDDGIHYDVHGKYACFYGGAFSQWYPSMFVLDDMTFNCAEQWMMYSKAKLFKDKIMMKAIMSSIDPALQKGFGRAVANFDVSKWNVVARDIVYRGNIAKFGQNPELCEVLINSAPYVLVEASPTDGIWGIKRGMDYPYLDDETQWRGTNWLGYTLMKVRDYFTQ